MLADHQAASICGECAAVIACAQVDVRGERLPCRRGSCARHTLRGVHVVYPAAQHAQHAAASVALADQRSYGV